MKHATIYLAAALLSVVCAWSIPVPTSAFAEDATPSLLADRNGDLVVVGAAFGDSITQGEGDFIPVGASVVSEPDNVSGQAGYPLRIEQRLGIPVHNLGRGGETVAYAGVYRFAALVPAQGADIVFISGGTNDIIFSQDPAEFTRSMQAMINIARGANITPVLITIPPMTPHRPESGQVEHYNRLLRELAAVNEIALADVYHAYANTCDLADCYLLNLPSGVHPNTAGYDVYAETVIAALLQIPLFAPDGPTQLETALGLAPGSVQTKADPVPAPST